MNSELIIRRSTYLSGKRVAFSNGAWREELVGVERLVEDTKGLSAVPLTRLLAHEMTRQEYQALRAEVRSFLEGRSHSAEEL